jgi:hypothetical protein
MCIRTALPRGAEQLLAAELVGRGLGSRIGLHPHDGESDAERRPGEIRADGKP